MKLPVFFVGLLLAAALAVATPVYEGRVVGVSDGDTLTLLTAEKQPLKIRLAEIDTPESKQPYGQRAKQALSDLAFGKQARVVVQDVDRYGRTVDRVLVGDVDVNAELVRQGAAWIYRRYAKDKQLFTLEEEARCAKRGLWALPESQQTPPWEWRRQSAEQRQKQRASSSMENTVQPACGAKRDCKKMTRCAEAKFYFFCINAASPAWTAIRTGCLARRCAGSLPASFRNSHVRKHGKKA